MAARVLLVGLGGFIGASMRYLLAEFVARRFPASLFPWATFAANVSGCFAIGVASGLLTQRGVALEWRLFAMAGILGGYTTFSTFGLEAFSLLQAGRLASAGAHIFGQLFLGLAAVMAGLWVAKSVL